MLYAASCQPVLTRHLWIVLHCQDNACYCPEHVAASISVHNTLIFAERDAQSEVVVQLESLLGTQGFLKKMLAFKSEHVRTAAYTLVAHICYRYSLDSSGIGSLYTVQLLYCIANLKP